MSPQQLIQTFAVWGCTHLGETRKVAPEPTTAMQHQIKALRLQILVDPVNLSFNRFVDRQVWIASDVAESCLMRIRAAMFTLLVNGEECDDLLPGAKQWYRDHAPHIKAKVNVTKIPVPCDFVEIVSGAVRLGLFVDGPMDIQLGPRQQKDFPPGALVTSLVFERANGKKWKMSLSLGGNSGEPSSNSNRIKRATSRGS